MCGKVLKNAFNIKKGAGLITCAHWKCVAVMSESRSVS